MPYSDVSVSLTDGQVKKLRSKSARECGTTITLKPSQMSSGTHKISLTDRQIKHFNDALKKQRGVQIDFSKASLGAVGTAAGMALKKVTGGSAHGSGYKKGKGSKTTRNPVFMVQRKRLKNSRNGLLVENPIGNASISPMSNFDLIDAASVLAIQNFRGVFMRDQLPKQPKRVETGIINLIIVAARELTGLHTRSIHVGLFILIHLG